MMTKQIVHVPLGDRAYDIEIGSGNLSSIAKLLVRSRKPSRVAIITDEVVAPLFAPQVEKAIEAQGIAYTRFTVPSGEKSKSIEHADQLWQSLLAAGLDRKSVVVAVGGGVVGDLAGFVAATFARGIDFVQVPTTLLAQVDSSVGGKVGVNLPHAKNLVGAFWQPKGVVIDTQCLATLPEREFRSGMAEVVKYGVILDEAFFALLEANVGAIRAREDDILRKIIARSCELKAQVVTLDEREETGHRAVLNYGHTFCHAFEAATSYGTLLHGEAVAMGMHCAALLAERLGRVGELFVQRQKSLLESLGLETQAPKLPIDRLIALMKHDKKNEHGKLRFVLPTRLGHVEMVDGVTEREVIAALES